MQSGTNFISETSGLLQVSLDFYPWLNVSDKSQQTEAVYCIVRWKVHSKNGPDTAEVNNDN